MEMVEIGKHNDFSDLDEMNYEELNKEYDNFNELTDDEFDLLTQKEKERFNRVETILLNKRKNEDFEKILEFKSVEGSGKYKEATGLFYLLELENECKNPNFIKWLMDKKAFRVYQDLSSKTVDYKFEYYNEDGTLRRFETIGEDMGGEFVTAVAEMREYYDQWEERG